MQVLVALALAFTAAPFVVQEPAPKPPEQTKGQKQEKVEPPLYDEKADAKADIGAAVAKAKKENRRVLIQWGGNWCIWCKRLDKTLHANADLAKKIQYEYDVVHVDIGHSDKNMELAASYQADFKSAGVPFLTVLDGEGKLIVNQETGALESKEEGKHEHDVAKVLAFLEQHQAPYLEARAVYDAAFARAKAEKKHVFLHFGAPWCGWCHRLENWLAAEEIAAIFAKDFVDVKIDQDRMKGAAEIQKLFPKSDKAGIPWFAFLDADGKTLAESTMPDGNNTGYPAEEAEIAHFMTMLEAARIRMLPGEVIALKASLVAEAAKLKRAQH
ncbi:MAG: thioredoxin family protein [Planctomycetes bacterium]|nr:thioredoxin family protein [Planctomycetota bacterium]